MRADARDNRARVLAAAEAVYAGGDAPSTEEVARRAGVGVATVFRHFPTKVRLLEAVLVGRLDRLRAEADRLAASEPPGAALAAYFAHVVADATGKIAVADALVELAGAEPAEASEASAASAASAELNRATAGVRASFAALLAAAQDAGAVRRDVGPAEAYGLLVGTSRATAMLGLEPAARDRMLAVVFDGLRAR